MVGGDHYAPGVTGEMAVIRQLGLAYMVSGKTPRVRASLCWTWRMLLVRDGSQTMGGCWRGGKLTGLGPQELCHVNQHACGRVGDQDKGPSRLASFVCARGL